ncbi:MAG: PAS domain S-box protein [Bacteroidota bacterium]
MSNNKKLHNELISIVENDNFDTTETHLFNAYPKGICITDKNGVYVAVNRAYTNIYGYSKKELIGSTFLKVVAPSNQEKIQQLYTDFFQLGYELPDEFIVLNKGGRRIKVEVNAFMLTNLKEEVFKVTFVKEISSTIQIEKQHLLQSQTEKISSIGSWELDLATKKVNWSEEFSEICGLDHQSIQPSLELGLSLIHPKDRKTAELTYKNSIQNLVPYELEKRIVRPDGNVRWVKSTGKIIYTDEQHQLIGVFQDITESKLQTQQYQTLVEVIKNAADAVLITENKIDQPGPKILFANQSFCEMTGYTEAELMGKTPRILQGPKTNQQQLKNIREALEANKAIEVDLINYKKNGEEFWVNINISPVLDHTGNCTHYIALEKDITNKKYTELQKVFLDEITNAFRKSKDLKQAFGETLQLTQDFFKVQLTEGWLNSLYSDDLIFYEKKNPSKIDALFQPTNNNFEKLTQKGLIGEIKESSKAIQYKNLSTIPHFVRKKAAKKADIDYAYGIPLLSDDKFFGLVFLGAKNQLSEYQLLMFDEFSKLLGKEIDRKKIETELSLVYNNTPDIISIAGFDGYFKKISPSAEHILGYTQQELIQQAFMSFVHPDDIEKTKCVFEKLQNGEKHNYFENRYISKDKRIRWLAWTVTSIVSEKILIASAKDITDKKELEKLVDKATDLAQIGGWEVDLLNNGNYLSPMTKKLHEVPEYYSPTLDEAIKFYKKGKSRNQLRKKLNRCIETGENFDLELEFITAKGNEKWVRLIGESEQLNGETIKLSGSFQDISQRKKAEIERKKIFKKLSLSEQKYSDLFHLSPSPKLVCNLASGAILDANKSMSNFYGYTKSDLLKMKLSDLESPDQSLAKLPHQESNFVVHQTKSGQQKIIEITENNIDFKGIPSKIILLSDVTEKVKQFNAIQEQNEKLKAIAWTQSHEVRAPLARIMGLIDLIDQDLLDETEKQFTLKEIVSSTKELDVLIKKIVQQTKEVKIDKN